VVQLNDASLRLCGLATHYCNATYTFPVHTLASASDFIHRLRVEMGKELRNPRKVRDLLTCLEKEGHLEKSQSLTLLIPSDEERKHGTPYFKSVANRMRQWKQVLGTPAIVNRMMKEHGMEWELGLDSTPWAASYIRTGVLPVDSEHHTLRITMIKTESKPGLRPSSLIQTSLQSGIYPGQLSFVAIKRLFDELIFSPMAQIFTSGMLPLCGPFLEGTQCLWIPASTSSTVVSPSSSSDLPELSMSEFVTCSSSVVGVLDIKSTGVKKRTTPGVDQPPKKRGRRITRACKATPNSIESSEKKITELVQRARKETCFTDQCDDVITGVNSVANQWAQKMENKSALLGEVAKLGDDTPIERVLVLALLIESSKRRLQYEKDDVMQSQLDLIGAMKHRFEKPLTRVWRNPTITENSPDEDWLDFKNTRLVRELYIMLLQRPREQTLNRTDLISLRGILIRRGIRSSEADDRIATALRVLDDFSIGSPASRTDFYTFLVQGDRIALEIAIGRFLAHYTMFDPVVTTGLTTRCIVTPPSNPSDRFVFLICKQLLANRFDEVRESATPFTKPTEQDRRPFGTVSVKASSKDELTDEEVEAQLLNAFGVSP
jgi:hypothetical protein